MPKKKARKKAPFILNKNTRKLLGQIESAERPRRKRKKK